MDQKTYPNLNPKMKETYDRIMGTTTAASPTPHPTTPQAHNAGPAPAKETAVPAHRATAGHLSHLAYNAASGAKQEKEKEKEKTQAKNSTPTGKKNANLMPILIAVGGIIFFVGYGLFWMSFFGLR